MRRRWLVARRRRDGVLHANSARLPTLIVDNGGFASETTEFTGDVTLDADVLVRNGGRLGPRTATR
ncbi:MAG: hypothetical protein U0575_08795 [Phycisphaerales bacterium]